MSENKRPTRIHPDDYAALNLDDKVAVNKDLLAGRLEMTREAPKGEWLTSTARTVKRSEYDLMTLSEKHEVNVLVLRGRAVIVDG